MAKVVAAWTAHDHGTRGAPFLRDLAAILDLRNIIGGIFTAESVGHGGDVYLQYAGRGICDRLGVALTGGDLSTINAFDA